MKIKKEEATMLYTTSIHKCRIQCVEVIHYKDGPWIRYWRVKGMRCDHVEYTKYWHVAINKALNHLKNPCDLT